MSSAERAGILLPEALMEQMSWYQRERYNSRLEKWWLKFRYPEGIPEHDALDYYLVDFAPKRFKADWADYALGNHRAQIAYHHRMHRLEKK